MAAGHNSRLQKMAFAFCCIVARRQPWLRFHCTAAAGRGIMMRASELAGATSEAQAVGQTTDTACQQWKLLPPTRGILARLRPGPRN